MTDPQAARPSPLAEIRARAALRSAGLDSGQPLEPASSTNNQVWLTPTHVVRVSTGLTARLTREASVAEGLPAQVRYPPVLAHGSGSGDDWLVLERVPGHPLAHRWPDLTTDQRRAAVADLAAALRPLHQAPTPATMAPVDDPPQLMHPGADPLCALWVGLEQAAELRHVDRGLVAEVARLVDEWSSALDPGPATTLIHGDLTFENVLHDGRGLTALLDLEWCRPGPADLDLDVLLRMCAHPDLHVAPHHATHARPEDYAGVPTWLAEDHPALVAAPRLAERLRTYAVAYEVRSLLDDPPDRPLASLDTSHPLARLARITSGRSHLDGPATRGLLAVAATQARHAPPGPSGRPVG